MNMKWRRDSADRIRRNGARSILFDHHDGYTTKMFMGWRNIEDLYKQV